MAAALNWNAESVVGSDGGEYSHVQTVIRANVAKLSARSTGGAPGVRVVQEKAGVVSVAAVAGFPTTKRIVTFEDGTTWLVSRKRGCNCR